MKNIPGKALWKEFKNVCGTDLMPSTVIMLQNVMLAQAQYLQYNNMQVKVAKQRIDLENGEIGLYFSSITL